MRKGQVNRRVKTKPAFNHIARGSALECGACLDVMVAMNLVAFSNIEQGKAYLCEIVSMLTSLARSVGERVREDGVEYVTLEVADGDV